MSSKVRTWISRGFAGVVALALVATAGLKLTHAPKMVEGFSHAGIPSSAVVPIALVELACLALYLVPRTMVLGAVLLTGYFGGAIVVHIIGGQSIIPVFMLGVFVWGGIYFRVPALPSLLPFRTGLTSAASELADAIPASSPAVSRQRLRA